MRRSKPLIAIMLAMVIMILSLPLQAGASSALEKLEAAKAKAEAAEQKLKETEALKEGLEDQKQGYEVQLANFANELSKVTNELNDLEDQLVVKEAEIVQILKELEEAEEIEKHQNKTMKQRIKFIYEKGDESYFEMILNAKSFSDYLNKADYIEALAEYDQKMLREYIETKELITSQKLNLLEEEEKLDELRAETEETQNKFGALVTKSQNEISMTAGEIVAKEAQLIEEEKQLKAANDAEKQAQEEYALSRAAADAVWREIGDVTFASGDEYLLASIIYCEAGGESYAGQLAVGAVVINRLLSSRYPNTLQGVIYQHKQFSPVLSGRLALAMANSKATASCVKAAKEAMAGNTNVGNCLYFRTPIAGVVPQWTIGGHIFY